MTSVLFVHTQTLYSKVTIPVALACLEKGWDVTFLVNRPVFLGNSFGFSEEIIKSNPTAANICNPQSFEFVADLIGLGDEWGSVQESIRYTMLGVVCPKLLGYDVVVGTTKNMAMLTRFSSQGLLTFALGYEHIPVLARVGAGFKCYDEKLDRESVFFSENKFSNANNFNGIVDGCGVKLHSFTYLDIVREQLPSADIKKDKVLIFHPGGYRGVISNFGDKKKECYLLQKMFLKRICLPVINNGMTPVVKVHPLRAQFHDLEDLTSIVGEIEQEEGLPHGAIELIGPRSGFWDIAFKSVFILTFGSSSIYELWSVGFKNVYVCNFEGAVRSSKFGFSNIFLGSYDKYVELVNDIEKKGQDFDNLTQQFFNTYNQLFKDSSVNDVVSTISSELRYK